MSKTQTREAQVLNLLREYPSGLRGVEIADIIGRGYLSGYIYTVLAKMQAAGLVRAAWEDFEGMPTRRFTLR